MSDYNKKYTNTLKIFEHAALIDEISGMLSWDQATYMPQGSAENRGEHLAELAKQSHSLLQDTTFGDALKNLCTNHKNDMSHEQLRNAELMLRGHINASIIPASLVKRKSELSTTTEMKWRQARQANNFSLVQNELDNLIKVIREEASILADHFNTSKYNAILQQYDEGRTTEEIDQVFSEIKDFLPGFIAENKCSPQFKDKISGFYPIDKQQKFITHFIEKFGFDFNYGRLDTSTHPFCSGNANDLRITVRYNEKNFLDAFFGAVHETGHAMYEQNISKSILRQPIGQLRHSMSMHESQSLFFEKQICRNPKFIEYMYKVATDVFGKLNFTTQELQQFILRVNPSFIRVDADEATYPMHVILRYEIERDLLEGNISTKDLPELFRHKMKTMIGVSPNTDSDACLQDIHWYAGLLGYFPTYTLGAITSAQLMHKAINDIGVQDDNFAKGDFSAVIEWLKTRVHNHANKLEPKAILEKATGETLNAKYFRDHLQKRYTLTS